MDQEIYDISDIPHFPYEPGVVAWSLLAATILLVILYLAWRYYKRKTKALRLTQLALKELKALRTYWDVQNRDHLAILSVLLRRCLSSLTSMPLSSASVEELEISSKQIEQLELRQILDQVLLLEHARFKPSFDSEELRAIPAVCIELLSKHDRYLQEQESQRARK